MPNEPSCQCSKPRRGVIRTVMELMVVYALLVGGAGTLINTGHPVAAQVGHIIQDVTFVRPTIRWIDGKGYDHVASGLERLSHGVPVPFRAS